MLKISAMSRYLAYSPCNNAQDIHACDILLSQTHLLLNNNNQQFLFRRVSKLQTKQKCMKNEIFLLHSVDIITLIYMLTLVK